MPEKDTDNTGQPSDPQELDQSAKIIFLRGQPSAEWLRHLGADYHIDPEFFQRHLDFLATAGREDHFVLPSLPSASDSVIQLSYFTISKSEVLKGMLDKENKNTGAQTIEGIRTKCSEEMESYTTKLTQTSGRNVGIGDSIVRNFHIFDDCRFAFEQRMTLTVATPGNGEDWTGKQ